MTIALIGLQVLDTDKLQNSTVFVGERILAYCGQVLWITHERLMCVADLYELVSDCGDQPALVGHPVARDRMQKILEARMDETLRRRLATLSEELSDPNDRLQAMGDLILPVRVPISLNPTASILALKILKCV